jgi:hypothetical protein
MGLGISGFAHWEDGRTVAFTISKTFPPDEEWPVAEVNEEDDGGFNTPAVVRIEAGERRLVIYGKSGQVEWDYPFGAFVEALHRAKSSLDGYSS